MNIYISRYTSKAKFAPINGSAVSTTVVTGITGKKIRVISYAFVCSAAEEVAWASGSTVLTGSYMSFIANSGISAADAPTGHFETNPGDNLNLLTQDANGSVVGHVVYEEI